MMHTSAHDAEKVKKAAQFTFVEMKPRVISLANAIRLMNKDIFPDDNNGQLAASCGALDMCITMLIIAMLQNHKDLAADEGLRKLIHLAVDTGFNFAAHGPENLLENDDAQPAG